jgi:hypothetical protein
MATARKTDIVTSFMYGITILVGSFVVLGLANLNNLIGLLNDTSHTATSFFIDVGGHSTGVITRFLDKLPYGQTVVTVLFWLLVGIVAYGVVLVAIDFVYTIKYERSLLTDYQFPIYTQKSSIIQRLLLMWILVLGFALTLLFVTLILIFFTLPVTRAVFMDGFYNPSSLDAWFYTVEAVLLLGVNTQIVAVLARVFVRSRQALRP